jgi:hypothetical protein
MDALSTDLRRELIRRVFPDLRYGGDPDIERYFEYRKEGRLGEALSLYNGPLRSRYPDDQSRIVLLKLYRQNDPRWTELQDRLILQLAGRIAASFRKNIDVLATPVVNARLSNAFRALSAVESILRIMPCSNGDSLPYLDRYVSIARLLDHRAAEMERVRELVGEYLAMAATDSPAEYDFIARSKALEERKREARARQGGGPSSLRQEAKPVDFIARSGEIEERRRREEEARSRYFDLSRIEFSAVDKARIEVPDHLERREDKVLAYCWKYWDLVADPGFERLVFIYSRKYGTRHYAIFRAIKVGKLRKSTDDEILTAVSTLLSTRYSYSVSGDHYMQTTWRRLRARAEAERIAAMGSGPAEDPREALKREARNASAADSRIAALRAESQAQAPESRLEAYRGGSGSRAAELRAATRAAAEAPAIPDLGLRSRALADTTDHEVPRIASRPASGEGRETGEATTIRDRLAAQVQASSPPEDAPPSSVRPGRKTELTPIDKSSRRARGADLGLRCPPARPVEVLSGRTGSVSDRIRKISGKAYDVYREIFLEKVRGDIHRTLLASRTRAFRLFDESANEAEDIIFAFMEAHYADPFMNWEGSDERARVEALGFALPSLDPIIEAWFRKL